MYAFLYFLSLIMCAHTTLSENYKNNEIFHSTDKEGNLLMCFYEANIPQISSSDNDTTKQKTVNQFHLQTHYENTLKVSKPQTGWLKQQNLLSHNSGGQTSKIKVLRFPLRPLSQACRWLSSLLPSRGLPSVQDCVLVFSPGKDTSHCTRAQSDVLMLTESPL